LLQSIIPSAARALQSNKTSWKKEALQQKAYLIQSRFTDSCLLGELDAAVRLAKVCTLQEHTTIAIL